MAATTPSPHAPSLKERQRQERERLIVQAAAEMLVERGYHDMAIDEIAARVGISKGTVYLHFASKEDLVLALLDRGMRDFVQRLSQVLDAPGSPREKLRRIFERVYGASALRFQMLHAVFQDSTLMGRLHEKRQSHEEIWDEPMRRIGELFEAGKASGDFDPAIPTPVLQSLFWSLLTPHTYRRLVVEQQLSLDAVVDQLSRFFFKGIAARGHPDAEAPGGAEAN